MQNQMAIDFICNSFFSKYLFHLLMIMISLVWIISNASLEVTYDYSDLLYLLYYLYCYYCYL